MKILFLSSNSNSPKLQQKIQHQNLGFTIVELLVVIVVIGILAAITIVSYTGISKSAIASSLQSDLSSASTVLKMFEVEKGVYPTTINCAQAESSTNKCIKFSNGNYSTSWVPDNTTANRGFILDAANDNGTAYRVTDDSAPITTTAFSAIAAISGTKAVGSVLTAGALTPAAATVTYQWQTATTSGGVYSNIAGATAATYTLVAGDLGDYIKVIATGTGAYSGIITSVATTVITTPLTAIAAITGTVASGQTLTAGARTPAAATVTYQWQRATTSAGVYSNIAGATAATYVPVVGDATYFIKVVATGTGSYTGTATSAATATAVKTPVTAIAAITGTLTLGSVVTAGARTPAAATVTYQWQRATTSAGAYSNIAGATASTYTLTATDQTKFMKVVVTGTGSYTGTATSAATTVIN